MNDLPDANPETQDSDRAAHYADMLRYRAALSTTHWIFSEALTDFAADHPGLTNLLLHLIADLAEDAFDDALTRASGTIRAAHNIRFAIVALNRAQTDYSPDASNPLVTTRILWFGMEHEPTPRTC